MLEYLTNDYGINPKPRAIVLTEGDEWRSLERLFLEHGVEAASAGVEFRSIVGVGNFSLANWQMFIEYMHEKQVLLYFFVDREGSAVKEAARFSGKKRRSPFEGLEIVIPPERIHVWATSYEEANFTDGEIVRALAKQGITFSRGRVARLRHRKDRSCGLAKAIAKTGVAFDKGRLSVDLAEELIRSRQRRPNMPPRPVEASLDEAARHILLNHQPSNLMSQVANYKTGLLG